MTRESPWDDTSRARALALDAHERDTCNCGCGQLIADTQNTQQKWVVDSFTCAAGKALAGVERAKRKDAEDAKKPEGWADGIHWYVRPFDDTRDEHLEPKGGQRGNRQNRPGASRRQP